MTNSMKSTASTVMSSPTDTGNELPHQQARIASRTPWFAYGPASPISGRSAWHRCLLFA
ncbi:hypothetical protein MPL3356_390175 [Mesorhizobium plurifarium]|uniref:Uncharacterized protein n=1 Tax=Mesorhizobium plurifarium TaxID=69974 RepID=A0A090DYI5_MESPL|nr:hypothetical protein MPL3356_390175 [Mesorhizobium plurifarium]